jgi:phospholipid N-methyltransferase
VYSLRFLREFLRDPAAVGAITPSSHALGRAVCEAAGVDAADVTVEFGPGTGTITEVILEHLKPDSTFFAMEVSEDFVRTLAEHLPDVEVIHDSAEHTAKYLAEKNLEGCQAIVSGLPWAMFDPDLQDCLLDGVMESLTPNGRFATYMYAHSPFLKKGRRFKAELERRFARTGTHRIVWANLPPAVVFYGEKGDE